MPMEKLTEIIIRKETQKDIPMIRGILIDAFKSNGEADLVETLREEASDFISLVAEHISTGYLAGHILFTPVDLDGGDNTLVLYGLGPMAVLPECQKQGIGSLLVSTGLKECKKAGIHAIVVLGHPDFYPRFGFVKARKHGIQYEYDVPDNLFMAIELKTGSLSGMSGIARYHDAFKKT